MGILFLVVFASAANAATSSIDLTLTSIGTDNPYGLSVEDMVTVLITYDETAGDDSTAGLSMYTYEIDNTFSIEMVFGTQTYHASDDESWPNWPSVTFNTTGTDWSINSIDFYVVDEDLDYWVKIETDNIGDDITLTAGAVPIPNTILLLGFGLFSLAGLNRKQSLK